MVGREAADRITPLVEANSAGLLAYFLRRVDQPPDAADLLAETLAIVWRRARVVPRDEQEARRWMYGVARRVLATHRRSRRRRTVLHERLADELARQDPRATVDEVAIALRIALATLDPIDQEIIRLVHWDGWTQVEVARLLELPEGTVRSRHLRARRRLWSLLAAGDRV